MKLIILILFTLLFIYNVKSEDGAGGLATISPNSNTTEITISPNSTVSPQTPSVSPSTTPESNNTTTDTPLPTEAPYSDSKMILQVNVGSKVNYTVNGCGESNAPCKSLNDAFQKYINFRIINPHIVISWLELNVSAGIYSKNSFQEMATKINLYELSVNISIIGNSNSNNPLETVIFDGLEVVYPFAFISNRQMLNKPLQNQTIKFENLRFQNWNTTIMDINLGKHQLPTDTLIPTSGENNNSSTAAIFIQDDENDQVNKLNGVTSVLFKKCQFSGNTVFQYDLIKSENLNSKNKLVINIQDTVFDGSNAVNILNIKKTNLILQGVQLINGRVVEAIINAVNCEIRIKSSSFISYTTREGIVFTVDCIVSIEDTTFKECFGTFSAIINYSNAKPNLNITKGIFLNNMVTNNGGNGDSIIVLRNEQPINKENTLPKKEMINVNEAKEKVIISNCTFVENNTPSSLNSGIIWSYNTIVLIRDTDFITNAQNDHGPSLISHYSVIELVRSNFIANNFNGNKGPINDMGGPFGGAFSVNRKVFPPIVVFYSSIRAKDISSTPPFIHPFQCGSSLIEFDFNSRINASLFVCDNIHNDAYNSTYQQLTGVEINSFLCEIVQVGYKEPSVYKIETTICSNQSESTYSYDFRLTKAIIAIIVILCTFLTLIPVVYLANKIYKNIYKGYAPHQDQEPDLEEFNINNSSEASNNRNNSNNNSNRNDGFHDVLYEDEIPSNKSLLK